MNEFFEDIDNMDKLLLVEIKAGVRKWNRIPK